MLDWIGGRKRAGTPAAGAGPTVRRSRDVIAALPQGNAVAAVNFITEALEALKSADGLALEQRFDEIQQLDLAALPHTHLLLREYLHTSRQKKLREGELWGAAYGYWAELAAAYVRCIQRYAADPRGAIGFRLKVPVALARALRALRRQLQWTRIRYAASGNELWSGLASLYAFAESGNVDEAVLIYVDETTTVRLEFLKALMQSAVSCEVLQPPGQDLASRVVSRFASHFVLSNKADAGCTHWFDLKHPQVPLRTTRAPQPDADLRYFGAGHAVAALRETIAHIDATRELPSELMLEDKADPTFVKSILEHVYQDWSGKTQSRQHERHQINARITVVPGFKEIMRTLEFAVSDSLDFTDQPSVESWVVNDVSEGGYGALIPAVAGDWVEVGSLVGVDSDTPRRWRVGLVRRVLRVAGNQQRVGVQLLGTTASLVRIRREDQRHADMGISQKVPLDFAILLTDAAGQQPEVEVLVRPGTFTTMDKVYMDDGKQQVVLQPKAVAERNAACERVVFAVVNRSSWAET